MSSYLIGVGNTWAGDDGIGPAVVDAFQQQYAAFCTTASNNTLGKLICRNHAQPSLELIDLIAAASQVIFVDAVVSDAPAGTIHQHCWHPGLLTQRTVSRASSHGFGLYEILTLTNKLHDPMPSVWLMGVEAKAMEPGSGLSPSVAAAIPTLIEQIYQLTLTFVQAKKELP